MRFQDSNISKYRCSVDSRWLNYALLCYHDDYLWRNVSKQALGQAASSAGLGSLYYAVPGILCIVAGASKNGVLMGFAMFFNIIAVIVSCAASIALILFTSVLNKVLDMNDCHQSSDGNECTCPISHNDYSDTVTLLP